MKIDAIINFGNSVFVKEAVLDETSRQIIEVIKKELPEEAQCVNVIDEILDRAKANIRYMKLVL